MKKEETDSAPQKELKTVHKVSELTGVSIRTLHYYDELGLLSPAATTEAGYRLYDEDGLRRLQNILLFRELEFPLKEIKNIIDSPAFDRMKALDDQIELLTLKRDRLTGLIDHAKRLKRKGEADMEFEAFDSSRFEAYRKLAKETWGDTEEYKEYEKKTEKFTDTDHRRLSEGLMDIFYEFGDMKHMAKDDPKVKAQVRKLQEYITKNYYTCTKEILAGLGQMYAAEGEMKTNIDVAGGKGCADFVSGAIEEYCK